MALICAVPFAGTVVDTIVSVSPSASVSFSSTGRSFSWIPDDVSKVSSRATGRRK